MKHSRGPAGFNRTLINENMQIKSVCIGCRFEIIGSAAHGLEEIETDHRRACSNRTDAQLIQLSPLSKTAGTTGA
jgi:hypothetical protein